MADVVELKPKPRVFVEKIGVREWELAELKLDVMDDVLLWAENPRLKVTPGLSGQPSQPELEAALVGSRGYDNLKKSIDDLGQMEPIYVWRPNEASKYLVLEGATRVTILRELTRQHVAGAKEGKFRYVNAKVLPPEFGQLERTILLARIHVRGSGVRDWGRYIEARFIYEAVNGSPPLMNMTEMAAHMGKSLSWVQRLKDAYQFARAFVEHVDSEDAEQLAARKFSTLEEISKATTVGAQLRDYKNKNFDPLRSDVFEMVKNDAFKEYRDARFLKEFHDDPDKWEQLKSGEPHIAAKLALEVRTNSSSAKTKVAAIEGQVQRAIERSEVQFGDEDIESLERAVRRMHEQVHPGVRPFRVQLKRMASALSEASMADVKALGADELAEFEEALGYFNDLVAKHRKP